MAKRKSTHVKRAQTPKQMADERRRRATLQAQRPSLETLLASGDYEPIARSQGELFELMKLRAALKRTRERRRLSLQDVAERSGIDKAAISRLENGSGNPTLTTLERIAQAIGVRIRFVLDDHTPAANEGRLGTTIRGTVRHGNA